MLTGFPVMADETPRDAERNNTGHPALQRPLNLKSQTPFIERLHDQQFTVGACLCKRLAIEWEDRRIVQYRYIQSIDGSEHIGQYGTNGNHGSGPARPHQKRAAV